MQRMTGLLWMIFTNDLTNFNVFNVICYTQFLIYFFGRL